MGLQIRPCYIFAVFFFFKIMHTIHSYNGTLVNLMDVSTGTFFHSLNDTVAFRHIWRSGSVATWRKLLLNKPFVLSQLGCLARLAGEVSYFSPQRLLVYQISVSAKGEQAFVTLIPFCLESQLRSSLLFAFFLPCSNAVCYLGRAEWMGKKS